MGEAKDYNDIEGFYEFIHRLRDDIEFVKNLYTMVGSVYKEFGRGFVLSFWDQAAKDLNSNSAQLEHNSNVESFFCDKDTLIQMFGSKDKTADLIWADVEEAVASYDREHELVFAGLDRFPNPNGAGFVLAMPWWGIRSPIPLKEYTKKSSNISYAQIKKRVARMKQDGRRLVTLDMGIALYRDNLDKWLKALEEAGLFAIIDSEPGQKVPKNVTTKHEVATITFQ